MATWKLSSGWIVTNEEVPLTTLGEYGYLVHNLDASSLIEHRAGIHNGKKGYWRYFKNYQFQAVAQKDAHLLSPRGDGEKTSTLEDALEGVGMNKKDRDELMKLIYSGR